MGMDMLQARLTRVKLDENEVRKYVNDISIIPLAIPVICVLAPQFDERKLSENLNWKRSIRYSGKRFNPYKCLQVKALGKEAENLLRAI